MLLSGLMVDFCFITLIFNFLLLVTKDYYVMHTYTHILIYGPEACKSLYINIIVMH